MNKLTKEDFFNKRNNLSTWDGNDCTVVIPPFTDCTEIKEFLTRNHYEEASKQYHFGKHCIFGKDSIFENCLFPDFSEFGQNCKFNSCTFIRCCSFGSCCRFMDCYIGECCFFDIDCTSNNKKITWSLK